jgi:hypothetical protein
MPFWVHLVSIYEGFVFFLLCCSPSCIWPFCIDLSALPGSICTLCALHNGQQQHHGILELT